MKPRNMMLTLAALGLATAALAGEEMQTKIEIAVIAGENDEEIRIELDSDDLGFNLHDMQEGESRSIVDESGRSILIAREADGFRFDVDGKTIRMPAFAGKQHGAAGMGDSSSENTDVHFMHGAGKAAKHAMDCVMIASGKPVDDVTQKAIRTLLESAGHGNEVCFIDREEHHRGGHMIKVIEKKIEVAK